MMMNLSIRHDRRGFTMIELIAVIVILSILTFIVTATFSKRNDEAKKTAALHEMRQIADAEKQVEIQYGYFVPLTVLDDLPVAPASVSNADVIGDHANFLIVDPATGANPDLDAVRNIRDMLAGRSTLSTDTIFSGRWKGPYLEYQAGRKYNDGVLGADIPTDPWGGPYRFLSKDGREIDSRGTVGGTGFSISTIGRYAIVSWGKDSTGNTDDDLFYSFN